MYQPSQQLTQYPGLMPEPGAGQGTELLRIVIAADAAARDELASMAGAFDDIVVLAEIEPDERLASRVRVLTPDVLLCDVGPDAAPLASIARIATPALLLLSNPAHRFDAVAAGAHGVLERSASPRRIHAALRAVGEGLHVADSETLAEPASQPEPDWPGEALTARELDVIRLLASGMTNKEIAQRLGITEHTVKFHVNAILGKLEAETRTEAVVNAARRGIVVL